MMSEKTAPRLHIIFARRKPRAVILLRGPSDWYQIISWNTVRDTFDHGAWFRGRIYEEKCDLSPDGELFLYFALNGRWQSSYSGTWTAVSRPPWLYALTLWPMGDTWGGGGRFWDDRKIVLDGAVEAHPAHPLKGIEILERVEGVDRYINPPSPEISHSDWSGYDQSGCPIFTLQGKLYRKLPNGDRELCDFNGLVPNPVEAPEWARRPLRN